MRHPDRTMTSMASTLIQWVIRTTPEWTLTVRPSADAIASAPSSRRTPILRSAPFFGCGRGLFSFSLDPRLAHDLADAGQVRLDVIRESLRRPPDPFEARQ